MQVSVKITSPSEIVSITNSAVAVGKHLVIVPNMKSNTENYVTANTNSCPIGGMDCMQADGDLLITSNWGYGLQIYRISDAGQLTLLEQNTYSNSTWHSLAVNKTRGKIYVGTYWHGTICEFDYSAFKNGGSGSLVMNRAITSGTNNLPYVQYGYPYWNAMGFAGDWLYFNRYESNIGSYMERWNPTTNVYQQIPVVRGGTYGIYNGGVFYDQANDRMYSGGVSGSGGLFVTINASTSSPTSYRIRTGGYGYDWNTFPSIYVSPTNPNHIIVWVYGYRLVKFDITNCLLADGSGGTDQPAVVWASSETNASSDLWTGLHGLYRPEDFDMAIIRADRGVGFGTCLVDLDNGIIIGSPLDHYTYSTKPLCSSYAYNFRKIRSAGATPTWYWVWNGHGYHGHTNYVFSSDKGPRLETNWDVVFGVYTLTGNLNIRSIIASPGTINAPTDTTLTIYASNNNGVSWQTVAPNIFTDFTSTGYQLKVKIVGTGTNTKCSYIKMMGSMVVTYLDTDSGSIAGKKIIRKLAGISH